MARLWLSLALLVFGTLTVDCKVVFGDLHTTAESLTDIYLGNFIFDAKGGSVAVSSTSEVEGQRFLFFDESKSAWTTVLEMYTELSCEELSKLSLLVTEDASDGSITEGLAVHSGNYQAELSIAPTAEPKRWYTMLSNCRNRIDINFKFTYLNPGGFWYSQFSVDEHGLLQLFLFFTLLYTSSIFFALASLWPQLCNRTIHPLTCLIGLSAVFEWVYVLMEASHGVVYAKNGVGLEALQTVGEVADAASNIVLMATMLLLAKGWTQTSSMPTVPREWTLAVSCGFVGMFSLYILERLAREMDTKYCYDSNLGAFALVLRLVICGYFLYCLRHCWEDEAQLHRRSFLRQFGVAATLWCLPLTTRCEPQHRFVVLPLTWAFAHTLAFYWRMRFVLVTSMVAHTIGIGALAFLVWPKESSEYSTLPPADMMAASGLDNYDEI